MSRLLALDYKKTKWLFFLLQLVMSIMQAFALHLNSTAAGIAALVSVVLAALAFVLFLRKKGWFSPTSLLFKLLIMQYVLFVFSYLFYDIFLYEQYFGAIVPPPAVNAVVSAASSAGVIYSLLADLTVFVMYIIGLCLHKVDSEL